MLLLGYLIYGRIVERNFAPDAQRVTPAVVHNDALDYVPMPTWKVFLVQFLNIAGTGPIFGAIQGILFGPAAYIWIVLGCIFGGAVHDFMCGVISLRKDGASLPDIVGGELGTVALNVMRVFSLVLLVLVGAVFISTPAGLLANMTAGWGPVGTSTFWCIAILLYFLLATLLPVDKVIGRIYPLFGVALLVMAVGILIGIFTHAGTMPEVTEAFTNHHPATNLSVVPGVCITIACGAVSGFHATQSPLMARCLKNERHARPVFYGAMIVEGLVALIWAAAAIKFASASGAPGATPYEQLQNLMTDNGAHGVNPAILVNTICRSWMGTVGALLAVLGVVLAPITSGDTAFRSARLIVNDIFHLSQKNIGKRVLVTLPLFAIAIFLLFIDFSVLWRYFAWCNQTLATVLLWAATVWMAKRGKHYLIGLVPSVWMTFICGSYIFAAPEGFCLSPLPSLLIGLGLTIVVLAFFVRWKRKKIRVEE